MSVADIRTGTGLWLLDLARELPSSVTLHGYDISDKQFPPSQMLPQNVSLKQLDSLGDVPTELQGRYDVVHLRMWASNMSSKEVGSFICNLSKMLKPRGYIQWEDADLYNQVIRTKQVEEFDQQMKELFKLTGRDYSWIQNLPSSLQRQEFKIVDHRNASFADDLVYLCTNTYLTAIGEIIEGIKRTASGPLRSTVQKAESSLSLLLSQNNGATYNWGPISILAQRS
uniref:Methyltransferase domain-containing protein n=1 Tax=Photinus pyralis TaxID=7054 RepID=A0A1Y1KF25_PHOPY